MSALAVDGGAPVRSVALPPWPVFGTEEREAVDAVLRSGRVNYWTGGEGRAFEHEWAAYCGSKHAIAVSNGTTSLELLLRAFGIGDGDEVIVTPRSFMASVSAPVAVGARPVFADVDLDSQALDVASVAAAITPRTRAILPVHLAGWPADMDAIMDLAAAHDLVVIEDCAQAHGARYRGRPLGAIGHGGSWSFCQDKVLTTGGEGGIITLDDEQAWRAAWAYKDHGKSYEAVFEREHPPGYRWLIESFGTNMRMTEMQAAIGRVILRSLDAWVHQRRRNAVRLFDRLANQPALRIPRPPEHIDHAWYKAYAFVVPEALAHGWDRDRVMNAIAAEGIPTFSGSCSELYLERAVPEAWRPAGGLPNAMQLGATALMWMVHPTMDDGDIDDTALAIEKVLAVATR
jgi:dTDP-4-amino-4,6-dideoxygalactose transaminase